MCIILFVYKCTAVKCVNLDINYERSFEREQFIYWILSKNNKEYFSLFILTIE